MEYKNLELKGFIENVFKPFADEMRASFEEVISALREFARNVDQRFDEVGCDIGGMKQRQTRIEATMVTKDYLDNKLADHGVQYGGLDRKTNEKIHVLADALVAERSLSVGAAKRVVTAEPFPRRKT